MSEDRKIDVLAMSRHIAKARGVIGKLEDLSNEDFERYRSIEWLMPSVDVHDVLARLGVRVDHMTGDQVWSWCPDHEMFTGRVPSDPRWTVNSRTGSTFCFTESRGSNLFFTVKRILNDSRGEEVLSDDIVRFMINAPDDSSLDNLLLYGAKNRIRRLRTSRDGQESFSPAIENNVPASELEDIEACLQNRFAPHSLYEFFMRPPGKSPTNIRKETVDHFKVFLKTSGFYADRAVIPYFFNGKLLSFCAIDILGKDAWLKAHPLADETKYRKTRFPEGSSSKNYLFGYDEVEVGQKTVILVEGARERMKLWQEGFQNTLAINGSYFGGEKFMLLASKAPEEVVILLDGDKAGRSAAENIMKSIQPVFGDKVYMADPGDGLDPKNLDHDGLSAVIENCKKSTTSI